MDHNEFSREIYPKFFDGFSFHVIGFMALPFLREDVKFSRIHLGKIFFRLYYPFLLLACLMGLVILVTASERSFTDIIYLPWALYSADALILKKSTGMGLLWFLPCLFALLFVKSLLDLGSVFLKRIAFILLLGVHIFIGSIGSKLQPFLPFGLLTALYIIPLCYVVVCFHRNVFLLLKKETAFMISICVFSIVKYWQISLGLSQETGFLSVLDYTNLSGLLVNDLEAIFGAIMVFQASRFDLGKFVEKCGEYSLQIYLLHAFSALLVYKLVMLAPAETSDLSKFILSMSVTALLSTLVAEIMMKNYRIRRFVFPRDYQHLMGGQQKSPYVMPSRTGN